MWGSRSLIYIFNVWFFLNIILYNFNMNFSIYSIKMYLIHKAPYVWFFFAEIKL